MAEIRTVFLEGDPTSLGTSHGRLLAEEIRFMAEQADRHVFRRVGAIRGIPLRLVAQGFALVMGRHIPPPIREEIRAMARESGVPYANLLLINTLDDVLNILRRLAPRSPHLACSSFALFGTRSSNGLIHGRNLDYHFRGTPLDDAGAVARLLLKEATLFIYRPSGKSAFLSIGWPGMVGAITAMNLHRLSLANLTSYLRGTTPNGTPTAILYRRIMEEASCLREAEQILRSARRTIGNNLLVGSGREESAALFEITRDDVVRVPPRDGLLVATNHFVSPELARRQRPYLLAHSLERWERLHALCDRRGVGVEEALRFLADTGQGGKSAHPLAGVANEGTAVSVLFRPADLALWLGRGKEPPASKGEFAPIDGAALLSRQRGNSGELGEAGESLGKP
jgi:hypothetical protein